LPITSVISTPPALNVHQFAARFGNEDAWLAGAAPWRVGFPAHRQVECDFGLAQHFLAGDDEQRVAGRHQAFAGVVGHFLVTARPFVLVVLQPDVVGQAQAAVAFDVVLAFALVFQCNGLALHVAHGQVFNQVGLAILQLRDRHAVEQRQFAPLHPDVGLDVGAPDILVDAEAVVVVQVVIGKRGLRCAHRGCDAQRLEHWISPVVVSFAIL
jgi:hypothetical protein